MTNRGIVVRAYGKSFIVKYRGESIPCEIRGKVKRIADATTPVAVGDEVAFTLNQDGSGVIEKVFERRTMFFRPGKGTTTKKQVIAANIDQLAAVVSVKHPELKPGLIDRFLIAADIGRLSPIVIINKIDLGPIDELEDIRDAYEQINISVFIVSALTGEGFDKLEPILADHKTIFAGHSGVGKTTILNRLIPGLDMKVGEVSDYSKKGIHTTSMVELFELPHGGYIVDSPGLKVLGLWELERNQLIEYFPEMHKFLDLCRFTECSHTHEPDCAVKEAVDRGEISKFRYKSYVAIRKSLEK
jgi:ribosome biogenesis GTPase / thiamine phosphate phosphatase